MRSESTRFLGHPKDTKPMVGLPEEFKVIEKGQNRRANETAAIVGV
jgi:hypothetical protein